MSDDGIQQLERVVARGDVVLGLADNAPERVARHHLLGPEVFGRPGALPRARRAHEHHEARRREHHLVHGAVWQSRGLLSATSVDVASVLHSVDEYGHLAIVDLEDHAVVATTSRPQTGELAHERFADPARRCRANAPTANSIATDLTLAGS